MAGAFQAHQPRTTAETQPKSNHNHHHGKTQPKSNRNKNPPNHKLNHTHWNQSTKPTKQPKSQNENTESEPIVKKTYIGFVIIF